MMQAIDTIESATVLMPRTDIDTDQIIPARFLTTTTRRGLGDALFADWRYAEDGSPDPAFVLNAPDAEAASVLVAGRNFGCGSSREHAPWALHDFGFRAVVSTEIADIFRSNALKNGLLPIVVDEEFHAALLSMPCRVSIDLPASRIAILDGPHAGLETRFPIDDFSRYCLMRGIDQLGFLLDQADAIGEFEARHDQRSPA